MAYIITKTNGQIYTVLDDGVVDQSLGISLIGQNYQNYGQLIANNFLHLLENSSNSTPPTNPIAGQLWWNDAEEVLSFFDGNKFKACSSSELGPTPPFQPLDGDQWWNTTSNQLNVWNGTDWMVVGPSYSKGQGFSGLTTETVTDNASQQHIISTLQSDAQVVALVNAGLPFTLSVPIGNISNVGTGITLTPTSFLTGNIKVSGGTINGTVIGAVTAAAATFTTSTVTALQTASNLTVLSNVIIGTTGNIINISHDIAGIQQITSTSKINIQSGNAAVTLDPIGLGNVTVNANPTVGLGVATKNYVDTTVSTSQSNSSSYTDSSITALVNGASLSTLNALSNAINNEVNYYLNTNAAIALTYSAIALKANTLNTILTGVTTISNEIAKVFVSDSIYTPGTLVVFGGTQEITTSSTYCDQRVAGVVSSSAVANVNLPVSLSGKVLCNVVGPVTKGDILVQSTYTGTATKLYNNSQWLPGCVIGKSLVTDSDTGERLIMIAVGRF